MVRLDGLALWVLCNDQAVHILFRVVVGASCRSHLFLLRLRDEENAQEINDSEGSTEDEGCRVSVVFIKVGAHHWSHDESNGIRHHDNSHDHSQVVRWIHIR